MKKNFNNTCFWHFTKVVMVAMILLAINFSCKNEDEQEPLEQLPVFGTCKVVAVNGRLSQSATDNTFTYVTNGGGSIHINGFTITITHKDYPQFKIEFWGEGHENLNGKHIKDWEGTRRSFVFPDGAKLTMISSSAKELFHSLTIYDGQQCHHINTSCNPSNKGSSNTLEYSSANSKFTKRLDDAEPDGETGTFKITSTRFLYNNIYNETSSGQKVEKEVPLGESYFDNPKLTTDFYDDPRLANT
jgi:hypothetical protein